MIYEGTGRNSLGVDQIEDELFGIFRDIEECHENSHENFVIPSNRLVDVFRKFREYHEDIVVVTEEEEAKIQHFFENQPEIEVTPQFLAQVIAKFVETTQNLSPQSSPEKVEEMLSSSEDERGREGDADRHTRHGVSSRSSSSGRSTGSHRSSGSAPNFPPRTPLSSPPSDSPFETGKRQRTAPLQHVPPSSWSSRKAVPIQRRKSDADVVGRDLSDSESTPFVSRRRSSRSGSGSRGPSVPTSPLDAHANLWMSSSSPPAISSPPMRPHSRSQSHGHYGLSSSTSSKFQQFSPEEFDRFCLERMASPDRDLHQEDSFGRIVTSVPLPGQSVDSDSDSEDDDDRTMGLVLGETATRSSPFEKMETLQRDNAELKRKIEELERINHSKLSEHEEVIVRLENRIEELRGELSAARGEGRELRGKETKYIHQISSHESEIAKLQRQLETSKAAYQSLQKQYQEQCTESESLRNALRLRDDQYRDTVEKITLHHMEIDKWQLQFEQLEREKVNLEAQLELVRDTQEQLERQKQENLMLKETIDRMRFDMDELRAKADGNLYSNPNAASSQASISKSLGSEILRSNKGKWPGDADDEEEEADSSSTAVEDDELSDSGDSTEGEDVVQTIITRTKRKVASKARRVETIHMEDVREYSDAWTQHEVDEFMSAFATQTDPEPKRILVSLITQTEDTAKGEFSIQTEAEPQVIPVVKCEIEIQTDSPIPESSRESSPEVEEQNEELSSSSSTLIPPTPRPAAPSLKNDLPPSYSQVTGDDEAQDEQARRDVRVAMETIHKWHKGLHIPLAPIEGGISEDAVEEWNSLKEEVGFECLAIDKVIEMSLKTGQRKPASEDDKIASGSTSTRRVDRKGRFYNIYNTFVYGHPERDTDRQRTFATNLTQACVIGGVFAVVASVITAPYMQPQYNVPGAPTYYDRAAWTAFNRLHPTGEGIGPDGAATVWNFLGRVGGEAARMARGWPT